MLTAAQTSVLQAHIRQSADMQSAYAAKDTHAIAAMLNVVVGPFIWKTQVPVEDIARAVVWTEFATLSADNKNLALSMARGTFIDATAATFREGSALIFGQSQTAANIAAACQRQATRLESLFIDAEQVCSLYGYVASASDVANACFNDDGSER